MEQHDITPRNRAERIRKRAWKHRQQGDHERADRLTALAAEAHTIQEVA